MEPIVIGTALLLLNKFTEYKTKVGFDQKILLAKRMNTLHCEGFYSCPGGKLDPGECIIDCIKRETREETGLEVLPIPTGFLGQHPNTDIGHVVCHWFYAIIDEVPVDFIELNALGQPKVTGWKWYDSHNLPENTMFGTRMALEHFHHNELLFKNSDFTANTITYGPLVPGTGKERREGR